MLSQKGVIVANKIFVRIEWASLILPIDVTLTVALFLIATWIDSRVHECVLWESSNVALLYHEVVDRGHGQAILRSGMRDLSEMKRAAKKLKAMLE